MSHRQVRRGQVKQTDRQVITWHQLPVRPYRHLITESSSNEDRASVVQRPEETVVRTRLDTDQLHSYWLQRYVTVGQVDRYYTAVDCQT